MSFGVQCLMVTGKVLPTLRFQPCLRAKRYSSLRTQAQLVEKLNCMSRGCCTLLLLFFRWRSTFQAGISAEMGGAHRDFIAVLILDPSFTPLNCPCPQCFDSLHLDPHSAVCIHSSPFSSSAPALRSSYCLLAFFILSLVFVLGIHLHLSSPSSTSSLPFSPLRLFSPLHLLSSSSSLPFHCSCISREPELIFLSSLHRLCYLHSAPCLARHLSTVLICADCQSSESRPRLQ